MTPDKETAIHKEVVKAKVQSILYVLSKQNKKFTRDFFLKTFIVQIEMENERKTNKRRAKPTH